MEMTKNIFLHITMEMAGTSIIEETSGKINTDSN